MASSYTPLGMRDSTYSAPLVPRLMFPKLSLIDLYGLNCAGNSFITSSKLKLDIANEISKSVTVGNFRA